MNPVQPKNRIPSPIGLALLLGANACGAGSHPAAAPPCEQTCQDGVALLGLRSALKLAYNDTVQAKPVGAQDGTALCAPGSVRVFGTATANAVQGASFVALSYDFQNCQFAAPPDPTADQNFRLTLSGTVTEQGTLAVQPSATTALLLQSDALTITGTVYDPPLDYSVAGCALAVNQNGNDVAGTLCKRAAGFTF